MACECIAFFFGSKMLQMHEDKTHTRESWSFKCQPKARSFPDAGSLCAPGNGLIGMRDMRPSGPGILQHGATKSLSEACHHQLVLPSSTTCRIEWQTLPNLGKQPDGKIFFTPGQPSDMTGPDQGVASAEHPALYTAGIH